MLCIQVLTPYPRNNNSTKGIQGNHKTVKISTALLLSSVGRLETDIVRMLLVLVVS